MIADRIYCYYEDCGDPHATQLLALWHRVWAGHGWKPEVLDLKFAQKHPRFQALMDKGMRLPTVNCKEFEMASFKRWAAFSQVDGAVSDFDVFPAKPFSPVAFTGFVNGDPSGSPGFMLGTRHDFQKVMDTIIAYNPTPLDLTYGKLHVSDMTILKNNLQLFDHRKYWVQCYGLEEWKNRPLIHFGNAYMKTRLPRYKEIEMVLTRLAAKQAKD